MIDLGAGQWALEQAAFLAACVRSGNSAPYSPKANLQNSPVTATGQWALEQAGLLDNLTTAARPEGQDMPILDKVGAALHEEVASTGTEAPEVSVHSVPAWFANMY